MLKSRSIAIACVAASLAGMASQAVAQGWGGMVPPWGAPTAASRSTVPSNTAAPFNAYYPAYGSYPDPIESRYAVMPRGTMAADSRFGHTANRTTTGYGGETVYYGNETIVQPQAPPVAEQISPPGTVVPMPQSAAPVEIGPPQMVPMPGAPAPMMPAMPNPCCPPAPCATSNPCCPPCPASWQHRCGQRMGDMLARMKECCDSFCAKIANCCQPKPQPCCWTGYQAWWHAPQPSNCMMNECLTEGGSASTGDPLDMQIAAPGAEVIDGAVSETYESADPSHEIVEEGPSLLEYGRPTYEDVPVTIPSAPASPASPAPITSPAPTTLPPSISTPAKPAGHVENDLSTPSDVPEHEPIQIDTPELPEPELVLPPQNDATT